VKSCVTILIFIPVFRQDLLCFNDVCLLGVFCFLIHFYFTYQAETCYVPYLEAFLVVKFHTILISLAGVLPLYLKINATFIWGMLFFWITPPTVFEWRPSYFADCWYGYIENVTAKDFDLRNETTHVVYLCLPSKKRSILLCVGRYAGTCRSVDQTISAQYLENLSLHCCGVSYVGWWWVEKDSYWFWGQMSRSFKLEIGIFCLLNILRTLCLKDFKLNTVVLDLYWFWGPRVKLDIGIYIYWLLNIFVDLYIMESRWLLHILKFKGQGVKLDIRIFWLRNI
jgi:hypothetical protein